MTDRELLNALLETRGLSEREVEAFTSMRDWLDSGENRTLSARQREWAQAVSKAHNLLVEEVQNLWSEGKMPRGIPTPKTPGEERAAVVLANRPLRPPRRSAS